MNEPFDNGGFEDMFDEPVPKKQAGVTQVLQEKVFALISRLRNGKGKKVAEEQPAEVPSASPSASPPTSLERKSFIPRFSFKAPAMLSGILQKVTIGIALVIFTAGVLILYTELPTHPLLIVGMILVSLAGNIITSRG